ncbi:MAG: DUF4474 domain-containing protein [Burkholderiales bacterium]
MLNNLYRILLQTAGGQWPTAGQTLFIIGMTLLGVAVLTGIAALFVLIVKPRIRSLTRLLKGIFAKASAKVKQSLGKRPIAGLVYEPKQDILFYSDMNAWQRGFGYCRLYDEAAALMNMIIDCEPVHFEYGGKKWLIEFWKGQYGIATGCEVGVYTTTRPSLNIPGIFNGTFYDAAAPEDMLFISCSLMKNGAELFRRQGRHWWLTGFKPGEFSEPSELTASISIELKDGDMLAAFVAAMKRMGYADRELNVNGNTVSFLYAEPRSRQPYARTTMMDTVQENNKYLFDRFNELTGNEKGALAKLEAASRLDAALYDSIMKIGRPRELYDKYSILQEHLK